AELTGGVVLLVIVRLSMSDWIRWIGLVGFEGVAEMAELTGGVVLLVIVRLSMSDWIRWIGLVGFEGVAEMAELTGGVVTTPCSSDLMKVELV
ncbi:MAG: hypothetical protein QXW38_08015, partial [Candidatus Nitrosotenuis sp.]